MTAQQALVSRIMSLAILGTSNFWSLLFRIDEVLAARGPSRRGGHLSRARGFERGGITAPGLAYIQLGYCHYYLEQCDDTDRAFRQAEKIDRSREQAKQWLAHVLSRRNTERDNERRLREALEPADKTEAP